MFLRGDCRRIQQPLAPQDRERNSQPLIHGEGKMIYSEEEIQEKIKMAPQVRENMVILLGEYGLLAPAGSEIMICVDYGKDIAYKSCGQPMKYELLQVDIPAFSQKILEMVKSWEPEMINPGIFDGCRYYVKIFRNGKMERSYLGQNKFPPNYDDFCELIGRPIPSFIKRLSSFKK